MKKSAIQEIFNALDDGNYFLNDDTQNDETVPDKLKELFDRLPASTHNVLNDLIDELSTQNLKDNELYFTLGFKLGLRLGIECG